MAISNGYTILYSYLPINPKKPTIWRYLNISVRRNTKENASGNTVVALLLEQQRQGQQRQQRKFWKEENTQPNNRLLGEIDKMIFNCFLSMFAMEGKEHTTCLQRLLLWQCREIVMFLKGGYAQSVYKYLQASPRTLSITVFLAVWSSYPMVFACCMKLVAQYCTY
jgi:hypothetical protein